ncbi:MAG TPA: hypothetical protein VN181_14405 [Thermoanaerobaculia bacterium]|nr:hypothetical protein [Thermoanaerobaculia bacterium]
MKIAFVLLLCSAATAIAAGSLFPQPLHLVKRIDDPLAAKPITVDEYCYGNRIVTVSGDRVAIADYAEQQITEIDHGKGTWSITRFDEIAKTKPPANDLAVKSALKINALGMRGALDSYEMSVAGATIAVGIDRSVSLSRDAVEALIGAAYPNPRRAEHEPLLRAAKSRDVVYGLPREQSITYATENGDVTLHTSVTRVDRDVPPPAILLIDPGATRVESHLARLARELREADSLPRR